MGVSKEPAHQELKNEIRDAPIDDIAFLANSEHRIQVLHALAPTPRSRNELADETDASRVTLARILRELAERHWIDRVGHEYELTPLGLLVFEAFTSLLETIETEQRLRQIVAWLPMDTLPFDVTCLSDADIVLPTESNPVAPLLRAAETVQTGEQVQILSYQVTAPTIDLLWERVIRDDQPFEGLGTPAVLDTMLTDPALAAKSQDLIESDQTTLFVHPDVDLIMHIIDDHVYIGVTDDEDNPRALIGSANETIYEWAVDTFEGYRAEATPIDPDTTIP